MHIPFNSPHISGNELSNVEKANSNRILAGDGPFTKECQAWLENYTSSQKALLTNSCTAALEMCSYLMDLGPDDEIIMPSYTFVSTANAFVSPNGLVSNGHVVSSSSNPTTASSPQNSPLRSPTNSDANSASPFSPVSASDSITALHGIPKMFRWLTDQYPNINKRINDGLHVDREVDNFYLDMNGIIHPCTHGNNNDEIIVLDETAMFKKIFSYVDR